MTHLNC